MTITRTPHWNIESVRNVCIANDLYTCGDCEEYDEMLKSVSDNPNPTDYDIYMIAQNIAEHSEYQTATNVMFLLANGAVRYSFEFDGNDNI